MQWLRASKERRRGCSRGRRRRTTRRGGEWGTVAARTTGTAASASGVGKSGAARIRGERRRGRGSERGEWERGPRERGPLAPLSSRGVHRRRGGAAAARPCSDRVGGTGKGRGRRWAGPGARGCGPVWAGGAVGGEACSFFSFSLTVSVFFLFAYSLFCFISFKAFRHFIKMCSLHHNYQCNIWLPLNIFV